MKKLVSLLLALTMLLSLSTTAMGAWYDEAVSYVVENGLMDSVDDPNADATRGVPRGSAPPRRGGRDRVDDL